MKVSVIIPVNQDSRLADCLDALARQDLPREAMEVLVVDTSADRAMAPLVAHYPARYLSHPGGGSYAARNLGVAWARGRFVAFTDADCVPPPGWLAAASAALATGARAGRT
jgi:glycosyltransferase involved in cell wall biosynthesis